MNLVVLRGTLSSEPVDRQLASGSTVWSLEVTSRTADGVCSAPVAWVDPPHPPHVGSGDEVVVIGQVRRRFFRAGGATQSRTEVVVLGHTRPAHRRRSSGPAAPPPRSRTTPC